MGLARLPTPLPPLCLGPVSTFGLCVVPFAGSSGVPLVGSSDVPLVRPSVLPSF